MVEYENIKTVYKVLFYIGLGVAIYDNSFYLNLLEYIPPSFFVLLTICLTVWIGISSFDSIPQPIHITVYIGSLVGFYLLNYKYLTYHIGPSLSNITLVGIIVSSILVSVVVWFFVQIISIGIYASITQKDLDSIKNRDVDDPYNDPHAAEILDSK